MSASVERVIERLGITAQFQAGKWWLELCPFPSHGPQNPRHRFKNVFVGDDGASKHRREYHCYSCKRNGKLFDLVRIVRGCSVREAIDWLAEIDDGTATVRPYLRVRVEAPHRQGSMVCPDGLEEPEPFEAWNSVARTYLESRGVEGWQVARWGIRYALEGKLRGRIFFPTTGRSGALLNYTARTFVGDELRYMSASEPENPDRNAFWGECFWPLDPLLRHTLICFEGSINGLAIERALTTVKGPTYLGGLSGSDFNHRKAAKLIGWRRIVVGTDQDKAGNSAYQSIEAAIRGSGTQVVRLHHEGKGDAAEIPPTVLQEALTRSLQA